MNRRNFLRKASLGVGSALALGSTVPFPKKVFGSFKSEEEDSQTGKINSNKESDHISYLMEKEISKRLDSESIARSILRCDYLRDGKLPIYNKDLNYVPCLLSPNNFTAFKLKKEELDHFLVPICRSFHIHSWDELKHIHADSSSAIKEKIIKYFARKEERILLYLINWSIRSDRIDKEINGVSLENHLKDKWRNNKVPLNAIVNSEFPINSSYLDIFQSVSRKNGGVCNIYRSDFIYEGCICFFAGRESFGVMPIRTQRFGSEIPYEEYGMTIFDDANMSNFYILEE